MEEQHWLKVYWRPAIAWQYLVICLFDFMIAPIMMVIYAIQVKATYIPWTSLTLSNGGLYHLSMGAIIGVTAWTRGQEKLSAAYNSAGFGPNGSTVSSSTVERQSTTTTVTPVKKTEAEG